MTDSTTETMLTFGQELLWMMDRASIGATVWNVHRAFRLHGPVDVAALRLAFEALARRHDVLRSTFVETTAGPRRIVHADRPVDFRTVDRTTETSAHDADLAALLDELRATPFDLAVDAPLRVTLVRFADDDTVLAIDTHHIASDGWSKSVMLRELSAFYAASRRGEMPALAPLPISYGEHAAKEREAAGGAELADGLAYWRAHLAGLRPLELPTDRPRAVAPTYAASETTLVLSQVTYAGLKTLARTHAVTPYMVLLATLAVLLARCSGSDDVVVGSPSAGRTESETHGLIGYFANTLVMRIALDGDPTFAALLERVRDVCLDGFEFQDVPLDALVLEMRGAGTLAPEPLFNVVLTMEDTLPGGLDLDGTQVEALVRPVAQTKFDLTFLGAECAEGFRLLLLSRADLFDPATAGRMLRHLATLLESAIAAPLSPVADLEMFSAAERARLADADSPRLAVPWPTVFHAFAEAARRTPHATALVCGERRLTYAETHAGATALAARLRVAGVAPGANVGVFFERSADAIVASIGVWAARAAYVPADPAAPNARLAAQFAAANVAVVVTSAALAARVPSHLRPLVFEYDAAAFASFDADDARAAEAPHAADTAYVLFTSGSTGVPKGVVVTHENLANYVAAVAPHLGLGPASAAQPLSFATVTALSADLGNTAIFPALAFGATLHVVPHDVATDAARFAAARAREPVDVLKMTPSHLAALLESGGAAVLPRMTLVLGGEPCPRDLVRRVRSLANIAVLNHYGPTETTVGACVADVSDADAAATLPIGRPLANVRCYVLDARRALVPIGVPGELFIGGAGVADGYLARPDLTAERFLPDPFAGAGARMYRTGDRVRRLASGDLVFLGRLDGQVKIRGYRVELAEIEGVLAEHASVADCAVAVHDGSPCAYIVPRGGRELETLGALRERLGDRLPAYMVPDAVVTLDRLPLGPSGKLDRTALAAPNAVAEIDAYAPPETETERIIAEIWAEALGRERVGRTDGFLALGGHSILAIRVLGKISRRLGVRIALRALFEGATVASLAAVVDAEIAAVHERELEAALALIEGER